MLASDAFRYQINSNGRTLRIRYFTEVIGSVWDDERTLTLSGTSTYASGLVMPLTNTDGSDDQILLEQGRIKEGDMKFFVAGSLDTTSGAKVVTVAISGLDEVYRNITFGVNVPQLQDDNIYKKFYGRLVPGGSLF